jgi:hypothetical protein
MSKTKFKPKPNHDQPKHQSCPIRSPKALSHNRTQSENAVHQRIENKKNEKIQRGKENHHLAAFIANPSSTPKSPRFHLLTSPPQRSHSFLSRILLFSAEEGGLWLLLLRRDFLTAPVFTVAAAALPLMLPNPGAPTPAPAGLPKSVLAAGTSLFLAGSWKSPPARALRGEGEGSAIVVSSPSA